MGKHIYNAERDIVDMVFDPVGPETFTRRRGGVEPRCPCHRSIGRGPGKPEPFTRPSQGR